MRRSGILLAILLMGLLPMKSNAQTESYLEIGIMGGGASYLGDLSEVAFTASETHPALGAFIKYNFNSYFGLKIGANYGRISGDDQNSSRDYANLRNLSFINDIVEGDILLEWNITGLEPRMLKQRFSPYVAVGFAVFRHNPQAFYQGQWYELQPLGTEGQGTTAYPEREPYKLRQFSIPLIGGVKMALAERWSLGAEIGFRKTFTDYLDDVSTFYVDKDILIAENGILSYQLSNRTGEFLDSEPLEWDGSIQRGDPSDKDWYIFSGITLSYNLIRPPFGAEKVKCPKF